MTNKETQTVEAVLVLSDGSRYAGTALTTQKTTIANLRIIKDLVGFQEQISDPANKNSILLFTTPHIGITGANSEDSSIPPQVKGVIVSEPSRMYSNFRATRSLIDDLNAAAIPVITNIDTRMLARKGSSQKLVAGIFIGDDAKLTSEEQLKTVTNFEIAGV